MCYYVSRQFRQVTLFRLLFEYKNGSWRYAVSKGGTMPSLTGSKAAVLLPIIPCFFGGCLLISYSLSLTICLRIIDVMPFEYPVSSLPGIVRLLSLVALAVFSAKIKTILNRPRLLCFTTVSMSILTAILILLGLTTTGSGLIRTVEICILLLINALYAIPYLAWFEFYARMDMIHVIFYFAMARILSGALSFLLYPNALPEALWIGINAFVLISIPLASWLLLKKSLRQMPRLTFMQGEAPVSGWSLPIWPAVLFAVFAFINNFVRFGVLSATNSIIVAGVVIFVGFYLLLALHQLPKMELKLIYQIAVPLMAAGALCAILGSDYTLPGAMLANGAYALFSVFALTVFSVASYRYGINPLWILGITEASLLFGAVVSDGVSYFMRDFLVNADHYAVTVAVILVVFLILAMRLLSDADIESTWNMTKRISQENVSPLDKRRELEQKVYVTAQMYGLTKREEEILAGIVLENKNLTSIAEELCIAESTIKTHSRHIYKKLGVVNKNDLRTFVNELKL